MRNVQIDETFAAVRQLPVEIEFAAIEQFVIQQPGLPVPSNRFLDWLNTKNLLLMLVMASFITAFTLYTQHGSKNMPLSSKTSVKQDVQQEILSPYTFPVLISETSEKQENVLLTGQDKKVAPPADRQQEENLKPASLESEKEVISSIPLTSNLLAEPVGSTEVINFINPQKILSPEEEADKTPPRVRTYSSSYCTFGDDDEWIKAFVRQMLKDGFIKDTLNLRFTITGKWLKVNGKMMEKTDALKYNDLYQSITHERLNSKSSISLSVGESSCSLSKSIDD